MGDLHVCCGEQNGVVLEHRLFPFSSSPPATNPDPSSVEDESWLVAEKAAQEVLYCVHPTIASEKKRIDVIKYIQRLFRCSLGCEVVAYGSVPLKTYLPDGDIDLTALSSFDVEDAFVRDVVAVVEREEQNKNAEYKVKDTQFIDAEVKLVKCLVHDIVIDISFNQIGGICTLGFIEWVDRLVGKDHLFKRSVLLIKAWCYYESRILGAHHGLISTYALETLVLYIIHVFHSSLNGPLSVLYRFLDYFSKFDWENYCISLNGPVCKASLPDIVVEIPQNGGNNWLLSEDFLSNCSDMFSVSSSETILQAFPQKHLNIIDPLRENNNLGRSVHRGNYYRICSALKYGAHKLGRILLLPRERIADEIKKFFAHTVARHETTHGVDEQNTNDKMRLKSSYVDTGNNISEMEDKLSVLRNDQDEISREVISSQRVEHREKDVVANGKVCSGSNINRAGVLSSSPAISCPDTYIFESLSLNFGGRGLVGIDGDLETLNSSSDLNEDHGGHIRSLQHGPCCHEYALSAPDITPPTLPSQFQRKKPWDTVRQSIPLKQKSSSRTNTNGVIMRQPFHPVNHPTGKNKSQGIGTYFPNKIHTCNNGLAPPLSERNSAGQGSNGSFNPQTQAPGRVKSGSSRASLMSGNSHANDVPLSSKKLEFGSLGDLAEGISKLASCTSHDWGSTQSLPVQNPKLVLCSNQENVAKQSYQLKNEADFPPLSAGR